MKKVLLIIILLLVIGSKCFAQNKIINADLYYNLNKLDSKKTAEILALNRAKMDLYFQVYPRLPNIWEENDEDSQEAYGIRVLEDRTFKDIFRTGAETKERAQTLLAENKGLVYEGGVTLLGAEDIRAGQGITVVIPNSTINESYRILSLTRKISKNTGYTSTTKLSNKEETVDDILKDHEERLRLLEAEDTEIIRIGKAHSWSEPGKWMETWNRKCHRNRRARKHWMRCRAPRRSIRHANSWIQCHASA